MVHRAAKSRTQLCDLECMHHSFTELHWICMYCLLELQNLAYTIYSKRYNYGHIN